MIPNALFYQLFVVAFVVICLLIHVWWYDAPSARPPTQALYRAQAVAWLPPHPTVCGVCAGNRRTPYDARRTPSRDRLDPRPAADRRDAVAFLSRSGLFFPRLARPRQHPLERASRWPALAAVTVCLVPGLLL
jgi:hypothetical protein